MKKISHGLKNHQVLKLKRSFNIHLEAYVYFEPWSISLAKEQKAYMMAKKKKPIFAICNYSCVSEGFTQVTQLLQLVTY